MSQVTCQISVSLDGYAAGPGQSLEHPLGEGGERLHEWAFQTAEWRETHGIEAGARNIDQEVAAGNMRGLGAFVMGRKMFGGGGGWDREWRGWWGEDPPYHAPVFVLTHHEHEPIEMQGGTTYNFVTTGITDALRRAREASGGDVDIAGGASVVRQAIAAGELGELTLAISPIGLGARGGAFDRRRRAALRRRPAPGAGAAGGRAVALGDAPPLQGGPGRQLSSRLRIFPVEVIGSASTNSTMRGYL